MEKGKKIARNLNLIFKIVQGTFAVAGCVCLIEKIGMDCIRYRFMGWSMEIAGMDIRRPVLAPHRCFDE